MTEPLSEFQRYLAGNAWMWQRLAPVPAADAPVILVDLMVDHPQYYLANLVVAKYLQRLSGARLGGFADNHMHEKVFLTAKSFGVETVHSVNDAAASSLAPDLPAYATRLQALEGPALRRAVLALECDGTRIGDLVYDSYLRANKCATIDRFNHHLLLDVSLALNTVRFMRGITDTHPRIEAAVVSHPCYVLFGVLCRLAEQRDADVHLVSKMRYAVSVQRYSALPADERCRMRICARQFADVWAGDRESAIARGQAVIAERMAGKADRTAVNMGGYDEKKPVVSLPALFGRAEGAASDRPLLCIMASSLSDAPHANSCNVFDDQYVWLIETLEIARQMPGVDWALKLHPNTGLYLDRRHIDTAISRYVDGTPNIRLVPEMSNTASLLGAIDGLITPGGMGGLEFATQGVPVVTAGTTQYSDLGFTVTARTADEYRAAIAALPRSRQSEEAVARASVAAAMVFDTMLSDCPLLPDIEMLPWQSYDETALWQEASERVETYRAENDPLWQRIERYQSSRTFSI